MNNGSGESPGFTRCIPPTGFPALDFVADLPGPGSLSLPGNAQFFASPSGAFLTD